MRKIIISVVLLLSLGSLFTVLANPKPKRLYFKKGQIQVKVRGYLKSVKDTAEYVLRVRAGQSIEVRSSCGEPDSKGRISITAGVTDPAGQSVGDNDMQGNSGTENTKAGDYFISVGASQKDDLRKGSFCIKIKVIEYKAESSLVVPVQYTRVRFENNPVIDSTELRRTSRGTYLSGTFSINGRAPGGFTDIFVLEIAPNDKYGTKAKPPFYGFIRLKNKKQTDYKLLKPTEKGQDISFKTKSVGGISYEFTGTFNQTDFVEKDSRDQIVLTGNLKKMKAGKMIAEAALDFAYTPGG
jgi:hypothetical protein